MIVQYTDYNGATSVISGMSAEWSDIDAVLRNMLLHVKPSLMTKGTGKLIFDPVGANLYIKKELAKLGQWNTNSPIPNQFREWGNDIDFDLNGLLGEAQFSNYPFLLNNLIRSELFFRAPAFFNGYSPTVLIMITRSGMIPGSNSSLYYEQAKKQLDALAPYKVFSLPIRLVGLFERSCIANTVPTNQPVDVIWTQYKGRTSREVVKQTTRTVHIVSGRRLTCKII